MAIEHTTTMLLITTIYYFYYHLINQIFKVAEESKLNN